MTSSHLSIFTATLDFLQPLGSPLLLVSFWKTKILTPDQESSEKLLSLFFPVIAGFALLEFSRVKI